MLEHVSPIDGYEYLNLLLTECSMTAETIYHFCRQNDSIGKPNMVQYPTLAGPVSPTSLRYLYHAHLILQHMPDNQHIVEIGCGYGGLCLAINALSKNYQKRVLSYACIDLDPAIQLQNAYLSKCSLDYPVTYHSASTYGNTLDKENKYFLISNYCFSEIAAHHQKQYIEHLFPLVDSGFFVWNHIPLYNFGKPIVRIEQERPLTGKSYGITNSFVFF